MEPISPFACSECRFLRKDLLPDLPCCSHPDRIWQDLVSIDGWPLEHDIAKGVWSECPLQRPRAELWTYLILPNRHVVAFPSVRAGAFIGYQACAVSRHEKPGRPMLAAGEFLDGPFQGHTFDVLE